MIIAEHLKPHLSFLQKYILVQKYILASLIIFSFCFLSSPGLSQDQSAEEQAAKGVMEALVKQILNESQLRDAELKLQGDYNVQSSGSYYTVTSPALSFEMAGGYMVDVGILAMNLARAEDPGFWKTTIAFPRPILVKKIGSSEGAKIDIGSQRFAGLWHEQSKQFTKTDGAFNDIEFLSPQDIGAFKIGSMTLVSDLSEGADGLYSGPSEYNLNNITLNRTNSGPKDGSFVIQNMKARALVNSLNLQAATDMQDDIVLQLEDFLNTQSGSPDELAEFYNYLFNTIGNVMKGFSSEFEMNGMRVDIPNRRGGRHNFGIGKVSFGVYGQNLDQSSIDFGWSFGFSNIDSPDIPVEYGAYLPSDFDIDIQFQSLPVKELMQVGAEMALSGQAQNQQMMAMQAAMIGPQILSQAGSVINLKSLKIGNQLYRADINALIKADATAVHQATVDAKVRLTGLDFVIQELQKTIAASPPNSAIAERMTKSIQGLTMLKMFGQIDPKDSNSHIFDIVVDRQGQVMINGASMQQLMGAAMAPPQ